VGIVVGISVGTDVSVGREVLVGRAVFVGLGPVSLDEEVGDEHEIINAGAKSKIRTIIKEFSLFVVFFNYLSLFSCGGKNYDIVPPSPTLSV
jgi:hypothetical protein